MNDIPVSDEELFSLDPAIFRTMQERIDMVTHPQCPKENLLIVAEYDTDEPVIEACAFSENADQDVYDIVMRRLNISMDDIETAKASWIIKSNPKFKNSFCVIPWVHAATNANGSVRACCQMIYNDEKMPYGEIRKNNGKPLNYDDDITKNRNAAGWKYLRSEMLAGNRPDVCKLCWDEEHNGIESKRKQHNAIFNSEISDIVKKTKKDGTIKNSDFPIQYWDLRFGNKCNIKCRSCGPTDSDQWYGDHIALGLGNTFRIKDGTVGVIEQENKKLIVKDIFDWVENSKLWDHIKENIKDIKRFYFTGGEPTVNLKHRELLDYMIEQNLASEIVLEYNTNMAGIPDDVFEKWSNFKEVHIGMSIDGIFEHFEHIRFPGKWKTVERNLTKIDKDPRLANTTTTFTITLSIMNVIHVLDLIWWLKEQKFDRINPNVVVHNLYWPKFYNIQNLPTEVKVIVENLYKTFIDDIYKRWSKDVEWCNKTEKTLTSVITHMNETDPDLEEFNNFFKRQDALDKIRKEDWKTSLKGISDILTYYSDLKQRAKNVKLENTSKRK